MYTVGDIARQGLLLNHEGKPYKHKQTIARIIKAMKPKRIDTPWGKGYAVTDEQIAKHNARYKR